MKRDYPERPIVAVGVVILRSDNVLLVERAKPPKASEWSLPGGAQDVGEPLKTAAAREVFEETGLMVDIKGLVDVIDFIDRDSHGKARHHYTLVDYWAETTEENLQAGDDAADARWFPLAEIDTMPLWRETKRIIAKAANLRDTI